MQTVACAHFSCLLTLVLGGTVFLSEMHVAHVIFLSMHCLQLRLEHAMRLLLRSQASVVVLHARESFMRLRCTALHSSLIPMFAPVIHASVGIVADCPMCVLVEFENVQFVRMEAEGAERVLQAGLTSSIIGHNSGGAAHSF